MALDQEFLKSIGLSEDDVMAKLIAKSTEDEAGLVSKRDELLGKNASYKENLAKFEGVDADKYREMLKQIETIDEKNLMDKGDFEKIREKLLSGFDDERKAFTDSETKLRSQLESMMIDAEAAKAVGEADGNLKLLMPIIKSRVAIVDDNGKLVIQIKTEGGDPATDKEGKPLSIAGLMDEIKADESYSGAFASSGLSGAGARPSVKSGKVDTESKVIDGGSKMAAANRR